MTKLSCPGIFVHFVRRFTESEFKECRRMAVIWRVGIFQLAQSVCLQVSDRREPASLRDETRGGFL
jgi:hypothetical protein